MLLKLTSNVSIDGAEHKAGTVIDPIKKGVSPECLLTWKWAVETDEVETPEVTPEVTPEAVPPVDSKVDSKVDTPVEPPADPIPPAAPAEPAKPPRKSRK